MFNGALYQIAKGGLCWQGTPAGDYTPHALRAKPGKAWNAGGQAYGSSYASASIDKRWHACIIAPIGEPPSAVVLALVVAVSGSRYWQLA